MSADVDWPTVLEHMGLVKSVVARHRRDTGLWSEDTDDLIADGVLGLAKAVRTYDPARGAAFSTFAFIVILNAIRGGAAKRQGRTCVARGRDATHVTLDWCDEIAATWPEDDDALPEGYVEVRALLKDREVIALSYTGPVAASILGTSLSNAHQIRSRARRRVLAALAAS